MSKYDNDTYTGTWGGFQRLADMLYTLDRLSLCRSYIDDGGSGHAEPYIVVGYLSHKLNLNNNRAYFSEIKYLRKRRKIDGYEG